MVSNERAAEEISCDKPPLPPSPGNSVPSTNGLLTDGCTGYQSGSKIVQISAGKLHIVHQLSTQVACDLPSCFIALWWSTASSQLITNRQTCHKYAIPPLITKL